ncbi:organic solvent tolerance ABC transporter ATP-binding protein [Candidatus Magnetoovum chiemensis]|nr:organic solvent tolerance ABC transporter ATP-binding protein [Candidatus Magnetoovum chiemensis]
MMKPFIEIIGVKKELDNQTVLNGINLSINKGDLLAIIGSSGSGKSVLLKNIIGLMKPDSGKIIIDGLDVTKLGHKEFSKILEKFGVLFQSGALFDSMDVYDNIAFPLRERTKLKEKEIQKQVSRVLEDVELTGMDDKYPAELSGGMKRRVALARAIILNPDIVFFDEPTTGLDPVLKYSVHSLIKNNYEKHGYTGIIISHEIPEIFEVANRVAMLYNGVIIAEGTPQEIINSAIPEVRSFIHCCSV